MSSPASQSRSGTLPTRRKEGQGQSTFKVIRAAAIGTIVEYYDFGIYGYMAIFVAANFFVESDPNAALLSTFAAFAVAFFLRVPGGIIFGHIGDKYGRKKALTYTILLMSAATAGIGLVPSYTTLGLWATIVLVLCRCLQGFAAGGEIGGAAAFVAEEAPKERRAFQVAFVNSASYFGALTAALGALLITSVFSEEMVREWAWRIPFLFSAVLGISGLYIRNKLEETEQFEAVQKADDVEVAKYPFTDLFRHAKADVLVVMGLCALVVGGYYVSSVYAASYLQTEGGHSPRFAFMSTCFAMIVAAIATPLAGYISDHIGRRPIFFLGSGLSVLCAAPMFLLMRDGAPVLAVFAQCVMAFLIGFTNGVTFVTFAELFRARYRYSGIALGLNATNMCIGGTAPFIATLLISVTGNSLAPAGFLALTALITFVATFFVKETRGQELAL